MQDGELSRLSESEYRLMEVVWENGQIEASVLAGICLERFDWKKSTVYTMLKRLGDKGALLFEKRMVKPLIEKEQIDRSESEALLNKSFGGSLPNFMAAFLQGRKLPEEEANRLLEMIEEATK